MTRDAGLVMLGIGGAAVLLLILASGTASASTGGGNVSTSAEVIGNPHGPLGGNPRFGAYDALFTQWGGQYGVSPLLLKAIAFTESTLNPNAANTSDPTDPSYGLMQISCKPDGSGGCQANEFNLTGWPPAGGPQGLLDPATSIRLAAELMGKNLAQTQGNTWRAVAEYNSGRPRVHDDPVYVAHVQRFVQELTA